MKNQKLTYIRLSILRRRKKCPSYGNGIESYEETSGFQCFNHKKETINNRRKKVSFQCQKSCPN